MIYVIFAAGLLIIFQILALIVVKKWIENQKQAAVELARAYFESPGDDKPSQFAMFLDLAAQTLATRIMQSARAQLNNIASIDARQNKKIEADMIQEALPGVLGAVPGLGKMAQKNPILGLGLQFLASKFGGMSQGSTVPQAQSEPSNGHGTLVL